MDKSDQEGPSPRGNAGVEREPSAEQVSSTSEERGSPRGNDDVEEVASVEGVPSVSEDAQSKASLGSGVAQVEEDPEPDPESPPPVKRRKTDATSVRVPGELTGEIRRLLDEPAPDTWGVLSWNIDGLDEVGGAEALMLRTLAVARKVAQRRPVAVLLQEVVAPALELLGAKQVLGSTYEVIAPEDPPLPYYVAILLDKERVRRLEEPAVLDFVGSQMGRQLLAVVIEPRDGSAPPMLLSTAHLETGEQAPIVAERSRQLLRSVRHLRKVLGQAPVGPAAGDAAKPIALSALAGDFGLCDAEMQQLLSSKRKAELAGVSDAFECCGSPAGARWTMDVLAAGGEGAKRALRRERVLFMSPLLKEAGGEPSGTAAEGWLPTSFGLVGRRPVEGLGRCASKHWGVLTDWAYGPVEEARRPEPMQPAALEGEAAAGPPVGRRRKSVAAKQEAAQQVAPDEAVACKAPARRRQAPRRIKEEKAVVKRPRREQRAPPPPQPPSDASEDAELDAAENDGDAASPDAPPTSPSPPRTRRSARCKARAAAKKAEFAEEEEDVAGEFGLVKTKFRVKVKAHPSRYIKEELISEKGGQVIARAPMKPEESEDSEDEGPVWKCQHCHIVLETSELLLVHFGSEHMAAQRAYDVGCFEAGRRRSIHSIRKDGCASAADVAQLAVWAKASEARQRVMQRRKMKAKRMSCQFCLYRAPTFDALMRHLLFQHKGKRVQQRIFYRMLPRLCEQTTPGQAFAVHEEDGLWKCSVCGYLSGARGFLLQHIAKSHERHLVRMRFKGFHGKPTSAMPRARAPKETARLRAAAPVFQGQTCISQFLMRSSRHPTEERHGIGRYFLRGMAKDPAGEDEDADDSAQKEESEEQAEEQAESPEEPEEAEDVEAEEEEEEEEDVEEPAAVKAETASPKGRARRSRAAVKTDSPGSYKCHLCDRAFHRAQPLTTHIKRMHGVSLSVAGLADVMCRSPDQPMSEPTPERPGLVATPQAARGKDSGGASDGEGLAFGGL